MRVRWFWVIEVSASCTVLSGYGFLTNYGANDPPLTAAYEPFRARGK